MDVYNWEDGFFVQDSFKVNPRLTLDLGLRYDIYTPFIDVHDLEANFDPNYMNTTTGQKGRYIIPSDKTLQYVSAGFKSIGYVTAAQSGLGIGRGLMKTDKNDWGPRAGFAYRITDKSVFRGGYGVYYPTPAAQIIRDAIATNPFNQQFSATPSSHRAARSLAGWRRSRARRLSECGRSHDRCKQPALCKLDPDKPEESAAAAVEPHL